MKFLALLGALVVGAFIIFGVIKLVDAFVKLATNKKEGKDT